VTIQRYDEAVAFEPDYSGLELSAEEIEAGAHRTYVGGVWDTHGQRQVEFLRSHGLEPQHTLLDVGCGAFRAGRHFIDYLDAGNYYGIEANQSVIQAGYDHELDDEQRAKTPVGHLRVSDRFYAEFDGTRFDYALAQSVFTHVSLNHMRLCLFRLAMVMKPGGKFYATFFEKPDDTRIGMVFNAKRQKPMFTEKNVFWYFRSDLEWVASFSPWKVRYIGDWGHPAGQVMMEYTRMTPAETKAWRAARAAGAASAEPRPITEDVLDLGKRVKAGVVRRISQRRG